MLSAPDMERNVKEAFPHISTVTLPAEVGDNPNTESSHFSMSSKDPPSSNTGKSPESISQAGKPSDLMPTEENSTTPVEVNTLDHELVGHHSHNPPAQSTNNATLEQQPNAPPVSETQMLQTLTYKADPRVKPTISINAAMDKGFFLADNEWTRYRENYFSCLCSYNIVPAVPMSHLQVIGPGKEERLAIRRLEIRVSAVADEDDSHPIELVQATGKNDPRHAHPRDVYLDPKLQSSHQDPDAEAGGSRQHDQQFWRAQPSRLWSPQSTPTEHRLQFKQASSNNARETRVPPQHFRLVFELHAEMSAEGKGSPIRFAAIARATSVRMIVRDRPPGYSYQPKAPKRPALGWGNPLPVNSSTDSPSLGEAAPVAVLGSDFSRPDQDHLESDIGRSEDMIADDLFDELTEGWERHLRAQQVRSPPAQLHEAFGRADHKTAATPGQRVGSPTIMEYLSGRSKGGSEADKRSIKPSSGQGDDDDDPHFAAGSCVAAPFIHPGRGGGGIAYQAEHRHNGDRPFSAAS